MNIIRETVENYYDNYLLEKYGITIFSINEGLGDDVQRFKSGVIAAIKKLKEKIGDNAGYVISDLIKNAKSQGKKTLFAVLTMLCVFSGTADAHISQQSADNFMRDIDRMYSKSESVGFSTNKDQNTTHYMNLMQNQDGDFYSGYGECLEGGNFALNKARQNAKKAAIQRFKETIGEENINDYEITATYYCDHSDRSLSNGGQKCVAMVCIKKKQDIASNQNTNQTIFAPTQQEMETQTEQQIQELFNKNDKYCIGYAEASNQDDAIKKAISIAYKSYSQRTGNVFNGDKTKTKCIPGKIQKKLNNNNQMVYCCTYVIKV